MNPYRERDRMLKQLGYSSYRQYLASSVWAQIRAQVLGTGPGRAKCQRCDKRASQVHHARYTVAALLGTDVASLVPTCAKCHRRAERSNRYGRARLACANAYLAPLQSVETARKAAAFRRWLAQPWDGIVKIGPVMVRREMPVPRVRTAPTPPGVSTNMQPRLIRRVG